MKLSRILPLAAIAMAAALSSCGASDSNKKAEEEAKADDPIAKVAEAPAVTVIQADGQIPAADGKLIVLDFNATWCGPCRQFAPNFESVADKYRGQASFYSIDVDQNPALAAQFNIQSIPTVVYIQPDGTTSSTMGYMDAAAFDSAVAARLSAK